MFCPKSKNKSKGWKKFQEYSFEIEEVYKGNKAWKAFSEAMHTEQSFKCNQFTSHIAHEDAEN